MNPAVPSERLIPRIAAGQVAAMARLMSRAEAGSPEARPALAEIYRRAGRAHVVGITGVPGSGKSTLVSVLTQQLRASDAKVAIIAVDPSSPFTGGSILGELIRMADVANDQGVFIRSMATRGAVGGIARATLEVADILDLGGFDIIIIETVGVGQDEVEIVRASHTTVVVSTPGLGDDIQAIKAGVLEIADIHVVSKADRSDANRTITDLKHMLGLVAATSGKLEWTPPIIPVSAVKGEGIDALVSAIAQHRALSCKTRSGDMRRQRIAEFRLQKTAETVLLEQFALFMVTQQEMLAPRLERRASDPYALANELLTKFAIGDQAK